jgi:type VI secretion system protein ImpJ
MRPLQRIVWSQGMMMSPQHFQQQDLYHETLLDERVRGISEFAWGAVELELDVRALDAGQVAVQRFAGILPSGCVLRFESGEPEAPPARAIDGHFPAHREVAEVYLGIPIERIGASTYAPSESERGRARYLIDPRATLDVVTPTDEESVDYARRNVVLMFGDEPREDLECLKIAEVARDAAGRLSYAGTFCPPALRVAASAFLREGIQRVLGAAVARWRAVAEERRHRDSASVEYGTEDVTRYLALNALGGAIPILKDIAESGSASPHHAYVTLSQLAGQLAAFSAGDDPSQLPAYHHGDPSKTFEPLFAKLMALLRIAVAERLITVPLEPRSDGTHLGRLSDPQLVKPGVRFVLGIQAALPEHQIYELVPRVGKLASWQDIPRLVNAATPGVSLTSAPRPPREVPVRSGKFYFLVSSEHALWQGVLAQRALAFHLPPPFDPRTTTVELLAIPSE